jgi:predicted RNase H-like HicB family nuclease
MVAQGEGSQMSEVRELHVTIHFENNQIWAEVDELPGCFAAGRNMDELQEALAEAIGLYLTETESPVSVAELRMDDATASTSVPTRAVLAPC